MPTRPPQARISIVALRHKEPPAVIPDPGRPLPTFGQFMSVKNRQLIR